MYRIRAPCGGLFTGGTDAYHAAKRLCHVRARERAHPAEEALSRWRAGPPARAELSPTTPYRRRCLTVSAMVAWRAVAPVYSPPRTGLEFSPTLGSISGSPNTTGTTAHFVTATNAAGSVTVPLTISISAALPALTSLSECPRNGRPTLLPLSAPAGTVVRRVNSYMYVPGPALGSVHPSLLPLEFSVIPPLPDGLELDKTLGNVRLKRGRAGAARAVLRSTPRAGVGHAESHESVPCRLPHHRAEHQTRVGDRGGRASAIHSQRVID
jgi:hypothetical protein